MPRNPDNPRPKPEDFDPEEIVRLRSEGLSVEHVSVVLKVSKRFLDAHFSVALKEGAEKRFDNMRVQAETLASMGLTLEEIAAVIGVDPDTVKARAGDELTKKGQARLHGSLKRKMYEQAMSGRDVMLIWMSKNYMNWKDSAKIEHAGGIAIEEERDKIEKRRAQVQSRKEGIDPELSGVVTRVAEDSAQEQQNV